MLTTYNNNNDHAYIRLLHAVPNAPAVDIYANDKLIAKRLPYQGFTQYLRVSPGPYNITIFPGGTTSNPVLDTNVIIPPNTIATIPAIGLLPEISLLPVPESQMMMPPGKVCVRFVHLSPDAPPVDITLPDGTILFEDIDFEEATDYLCINPGKYTLQARVAGTDQVVLTVPNVKLTPNRFYSVYAVGLVEEPPPLEVLIPLDGISYIKM